MKPPRKTESAAKKRRSSGERSSQLASIVARSVRCRSGRSALRVARRSNGAESRSRICPGERTCVRAAARASASGTPSSRRTSSFTAPSFAGVSSKSGRTACARSRKTRRATSCASGARASSRSPSSPRRTRDVATIASAGARSRSPRTTGAIAPASCSRLSRTRRAGTPRRKSAIRSSGSRSGPGPTLSARATAAGTERASRTSASGTNQAASPAGGQRRWSASSAIRVFPMPPGPVIVTSRSRATSSRSRASSSSRPKKRVSSSGAWPRCTGSASSFVSADTPRSRTNNRSVAPASR